MVPDVDRVPPRCVSDSPGRSAIVQQGAHMHGSVEQWVMVGVGMEAEAST